METVRLLSVATGAHALRIGASDFICCTYVLESQDASVTESLRALMFQKQWRARDAIDELGAQYHLTDREQQALRGVASGLGTRALAEQMNIRPSTLRAFLRLIKIKMGAPTRAEMMAKILQRKA